MSVVLLLLILGLICWLGYRADVLGIQHQRRQEEVKRRLRRTSQVVDDEYYRTKRAMNDAAGQSWRNLTDGGPRG